LTGLPGFLASGWSRNSRRNPFRKLLSTLKIPLIRVSPVQSAGEPERAPRIKAPAGKFPDDVEALASQPLLQGGMPEFRQERQPGGRKNENGKITGVFFGHPPNPLEKFVVRPPVIDARADAQNVTVGQSGIRTFIRRNTFSPEHTSHRMGYLSRVLVVDRLVDEYGSGTGRCGIHAVILRAAGRGRLVATSSVGKYNSPRSMPESRSVATQSPGIPLVTDLTCTP